MNEVAKKEETLSVSQLQAMLETMKVNKEVSLSADILTMKAGDSIRAIFVGMCEMQKFNSSELGDAVELLTADGMKKSGDKALVSTLRGKKVPLAILIECLGMKKGKNGEYREFNIYPLEPAN